MTAAIDDVVEAEVLEYDGPGLYEDMPAEAYHLDPVPGGSLSSSGARKLLPPSCPAIFDHERRNPPPPKKAFELGTAAHALVLGDGPELVLVDHETWNTNAIKAEVAAIRERGAVPLKPADWAAVHGMADALRTHPVASRLFMPGRGAPEQSLFWIDDRSGVTCRARLDWLPEVTGRRMIIGDYKSTDSAEPSAFARSAFKYGYPLQAAYYIDGVRALGLDDNPAFVLVAQEKTAPYLITIHEFEPDALAVARSRIARARDLYAKCSADNHWPGFSDEIVQIPTPAWYGEDA